MVTNWGEFYNRESMYETTKEYLLDGEKVKINGKNCGSLIDVIMEDLRMEIDKEEYYLRRAENSWESNDEGAYLDNFSCAIQRGSVADYLIGRLKDSEVISNKDAENNKKIESVARRLRRIDKCTLDELQVYLKELKEYQLNAVSYRIDGDGVNVMTSKFLRKVERTIQEIEKEIYNRQIEYGDEREC